LATKASVILSTPFSVAVFIVAIQTRRRRRRSRFLSWCFRLSLVAPRSADLCLASIGERGGLLRTRLPGTIRLSKVVPPGRSNVALPWLHQLCEEHDASGSTMPWSAGFRSAQHPAPSASKAETPSFRWIRRRWRALGLPAVARRRVTLRDLHRHLHKPVRCQWLWTRFLPRVRVALVDDAVESVSDLSASAFVTDLVGAHALRHGPRVAGSLRAAVSSA
jgi:hypothetical protein